MNSSRNTHAHAHAHVHTHTHTHTHKIPRSGKLGPKPHVHLYPASRESTIFDQPKVMLGKALSGIARCIYMGDRQDITQYSIRSVSICISGIYNREVLLVQKLQVLRHPVYQGIRYREVWYSKVRLYFPPLYQYPLTRYSTFPGILGTNFTLARSNTRYSGSIGSAALRSRRFVI